MFNVKDTVFYGIHGVCTIAEISKREFCGVSSDYYTLKPVFGSRSTVFVPVHKQNLKTKMRHVLSSSEINKLIEEIPDKKLIKIGDEVKRREKFEEIIKSGDRGELVSLIKTLYEHKDDMKRQNKKLRVADEKFLTEAEKMLYDEFSYVLNIERDSVVSYIAEKIGG